MGKTITSWLPLAIVAMLLLTSCNRENGNADDDGGRRGMDKNATSATLSIAELARIFTAGDAKDLVLTWIERKQPHVNAHIFVEYTDGHHGGYVYDFSDLQLASTASCQVYMLKDYTPVQVSFGLSWYADVSGKSPQELRRECGELLEEVGVTTDLHGEDVPGRLLARNDEITLQLFDDGEQPADSVGFMLSLTATQAAHVMERNARFTELQSFATEDTPLAFNELIDLVADAGAQGILGHFDFSGFEPLLWYKPLFGEDDRNYDKATIYHNGVFRRSTKHMAYLSAFDDGARVQFIFTPKWWEDHGGSEASSLAALFEDVLAANDGWRVSFDAVGSIYDLEYAYCYVDGVNVIRRQYTAAPAADGHAQYMLYAGEALYAGKPETLFQGAALLPTVRETGAVELFLRDLASKPLSEALRMHLAGFHRDVVNIPPHDKSPFSTRQIYTYEKERTHKRLAMITLLDDTYYESIKLTPAWLAMVLQLDVDVVEAEFSTLATTCKAEADSFAYGKLTILSTTGSRDDGTDSWYRIDFPTWP